MLATGLHVLDRFVLFKTCNETCDRIVKTWIALRAECGFTSSDAYLMVAKP